MSFVLVASTSAAGTAVGSNVTTPAIDTTGANLTIICTVDYYNTTFNYPTDSEGNTYTKLTAYNPSAGTVCVYYCFAPTVGPGHTATSNFGNYRSIAFLAFSGALASPHDQEVTGGDGATPISAGSITPTANNELIICALVQNTSNTDSTLPTIDTGFTIAANVYGIDSTCLGIAVAYLVQSIAANVNPTWTFQSGNISASIAESFFGVDFLALTLSVSDTISLTDTVNLLLPLGNAYSDSLTLSDSVSVFSSSFSFFDSLILTDTVGLALLTPFPFSDSLVLSDSVFLILFGPFIQFGITDSLSLSDSFIKSIILPINVTDSLSLSDTLSRAIFDLLNLSDTLSLTDAVAIAAQMLNDTIFVDVISLTDRIATLLANTPVTIPYSDSMVLSDNVAISLNSALSVSDTISLTDGAAIGFINPPMVDSLSFGDAVSITLNISLGFSDSNTLSDQTIINPYWNNPLTLNFNDSINLSDALSTTTAGTNAYSDNLALSDTVNVQLNAAPTNQFTDWLQLSDLVSFSLVVRMNSHTDALQFTDNVQLVLNDSDTAYLRRYLNDMDTPGNDSAT